MRLNAQVENAIAKTLKKRYSVHIVSVSILDLFKLKHSLNYVKFKYFPALCV